MLWARTRGLGVRRLLFEILEQRLAMSAGSMVDFPTASPIERPVASELDDVTVTLVDIHKTTGLDQVRATYGLTGAGQTVAVIDSGIAYDHPALGGGFGAGYRVVGGWDFTEENDADPYDDGPAGFHGTHVAGIIGSSDPVFTGVAPGVDLVGLRVFNDTGKGSFAWVERALRWVHVHRSDFEHPITAVNLSLGAEWNSAALPGWAMLEEEFRQLENDGIFISVAAGNSYDSHQGVGLSYPAASPFVVPVASSQDDDAFSRFSQRDLRVLVAPGQAITSTAPDYLFDFNGITDDFATASGTSMAAPYVAGASVLVREAMELVGVANISQDVIYEHLRETGDVFYDASTDARYHRLNLVNALEALLPADDFGATPSDAYALGLLSDELSFSGMVGRVDDRDAFTFEASQSGVVELTFDTTPELVATWMLDGEEVPAARDTLTFAVETGRTYTIQIGTSEGIGAYDAHLRLKRTAIDLGSVEDRRLRRVALNDDHVVYQLTASRDGILTVQATVVGEGDDLGLELRRGGEAVPLAEVPLVRGYRVDVPAKAGESFRLSLRGSAGVVDLRLVNLVARHDGVVDVQGTEGSDQFVFSAPDSIVAVNGVRYTLAGLQNPRVRFDGHRGNDSVRLSGGKGDDTSTVRPGAADLVGDGYRVSVQDAEVILVDAGSGNNRAVLHDSGDDDWLVASPSSVTLRGRGFSNGVHGFDHVEAFAGRGGNDRAYLHDSVGNDYLEARPGWTRLSSTTYHHLVHGFDRVYAYAEAGGLDRAYLYDSAGDDSFVGRADSGRMAGKGFHNSAIGFERVYAYAANGGTDRAFLYDSAGDDHFAGRPDFARLSGAGFHNRAEGFDRVYAYATQGGLDRAYFFDSADVDRFHGAPGEAWMSGSDFYNRASGFGRLYVYAGAGDRADLQGSADDDSFLFSTELRQCTFWSPDAVLQTNGFDDVTADGLGGDDHAVLVGAASGEMLSGGRNEVWLTSPSGQTSIRGFDLVTVRATDGETPAVQGTAVDVVFQREGQWM